MANDQTEVYRAELDISDFNAKADQLEAKVAQIRKARASNQDTSELEKQLVSEFDGLAKVINQQEKAGASTEDLLKQKERLGAVVRSVGADFSGMLGDLGGVVELMMSGSSVAVGLGAALATVGAASSVFRRIKSELEDIRKEQEAIVRNARELKGEFVGPQEQMAAVLQRFSALTPESEAASGEMRRALEKSAGFERGLATAAAPLAVLAGMGVDDAGLATQLLASGVQFDTPDEMRKAVDQLKARPEKLAGVRRQIEVLPTTQTGKARLAGATAQPFGGVQHTPNELAYEVAQGSGAIGPDVSYEEFLSRLDEAQRLQSALRRIETSSTIALRRAAIYPDEAATEGIDHAGDWMFSKDIQYRLGEFGGRAILGAFDEASGIDRTGRSGTASPVLANPPVIIQVANMFVNGNEGGLRKTLPHGNAVIDTGSGSPGMIGGGAP